MNFRNSALSFVLVLFLSSRLWAQDWRIDLPQPGAFGASFVAVAPDGAVFITDSRQTPDSLLLSKLSANGDLIWQKQIKTGGVAPTGMQKIGCGGIFFEPDSSIYLITNKNPALAVGYEIVHLDPNGTELSRIAFTESWTQRCLRLPDGDFMITRALGYGLRRIDSSGNLIWESTNAGGASVNFTNTIAQAENGDFFMAVNGFFQSGSGFVVLRTDSLGVSIANYDMVDQSTTYNIAKGTDGNFLVAGSKNTGELFWRIWSPSGQALNNQTFDDQVAMTVYDVIALPDGYLMAGRWGGIPSVWRLDLEGNLIFQRQFMPNESGYFTALALAPGGQEVFATGNLIFGAGASDSDVFALKFEVAPLSTLGLIQGKLRLDPQSDCLADSAEIGFATLPLRATSATDTFYTMNNAMGDYHFWLDTNVYSIEVLDYHPYLEPCGTAQTITPIIGDTLGLDFWIQETYHCPLLEISMSGPALRRCFTNHFALKYCNFGTETAFDSHLEIVLDPHLEYLSSTLPLSGNSGDTLFFDLGDLAPGYCDGFILSVNMPNCDSVVLGQTLCTSAFIFPDSICGDFSNWSGASMVVGAQCDGDSVRLFATNRGTATTTTLIDYIITEDNVILVHGNRFFAPMDTFWMVQPANGETWRIESEQEPGHPGFSAPAVAVEACQPNAGIPFSLGYLGMFPMDDADFAVDISCNEVIGSYDPNAKSAFPIGYESKHYVRNGDEIEYLIQFQNTGTDTAFTVVIRDTLPVWLDPASIRVGASSHAMTWTLEGQGALVFRFDNILLPDSNVNEMASHGWLGFRIAQKPNLAEGTEIRNQAAIFFDFNDPIITNQTFHTIGEDFVTVSILEPEDGQKLGIRIYPNPNQAGSWLYFEKDAYNGLDFRLYDVLGCEIFAQKITDRRVWLPTRIGEGVFGFRIDRSGLLVGSGKLLMVRTD